VAAEESEVKVLQVAQEAGDTEPIAQEAEDTEPIAQGADTPREVLTQVTVSAHQLLPWTGGLSILVHILPNLPSFNWQRIKKLCCMDMVPDSFGATYWPSNLFQCRKTQSTVETQSVRFAQLSPVRWAIRLTMSKIIISPL